MTNFVRENGATFINKTKTIKEKIHEYSLTTKVETAFLEEWRSVRSLLNDKYFQLMLNTEGVTLHEFAFSLQDLQNEKLEYIEWFEQFQNIMELFDDNKILSTNDISKISLPFLIFSKEKVQAAVEIIDNLEVSNDVINSFITVVGEEMFNMFGKLVAVELEIYKQNHVLARATSEERFQEFIEGNYSSKEQLIKFYLKYPVATRIATQRIHYLSSNFIQMLQRVNKDYKALKENFGIKTINLTGIELSSGDSHQQGNSVAILVFGEQKLVYKPRNLEISESVEYFLKWCHDHSELLDLKIPKGLYKEKYSYNEFILKKSCMNDKEVEKFYVRYGYLIAICYLLGINDLHMENIIAEGEYPIIIDIETMFQPLLQFENESLFTKITTNLQVESVMNSCLLPKNLNIGVKKQVELSALNGREIKTQFKIIGPKNINTDEFLFEQQDAFFKGGDNIPEINQNEEVDFLRYRLKILEGFEDFMNMVMTRKKELLQITEIFKGKKIRVLTKGTERYATMLRYANHPNYSSEMKYRERLMMNIWAYPYKDKRIVSSEIGDLLFNDVPIFFSQTDSRDIIDSHNKIYKDYFETSGFQESLQRIQSFNKTEFEQQYKIMLLSLGIADKYLNKEIGFIKLSPKISKFDLIREAESIAQDLIRDMIVMGNEASFVNLKVDDEKHWYLEACDESFYSGLSGIGLFFLNLYQKTHKKEYFNYYNKLIQTSINQSKLQPFKSAFDGWLSPIFPMLVEYNNFGTCVDEEFLDLTIKKLNELSREQISSFKQMDYISGLAGILRLAYKINTTFASKEISNHFFENTVDILKERFSQDDENTQLKGVAHGLSGLALSLLSSPTFEKEKIKFLLRKEMELPFKMDDDYKWCWGIPGMIQARIEVLKIFQDEEIEEQLSYLAEKFEKLMDKIPLNDSICHGTGGILMTLEELYKYSFEKKWKEKSMQVYANIKENSLSRGYKVKKLLGTDTKGLFDGLTSIGSAYLNNLPNFMMLNLE
ncbi:MAG: type 2 lantipeptide synthetase LanM [Streptococcaceae bacterium]|jgi:type 2 lantibiotic biosynthesis protein LanM|nr:type 2 lantipeptide synthetase LanM [Streptococcaceae bacterium]